jgi:hypothetical protein
MTTKFLRRIRDFIFVCKKAWGVKYVLFSINNAPVQGYFCDTASRPTNACSTPVDLKMRFNAPAVNPRPTATQNRRPRKKTKARQPALPISRQT